MTDDPRDAHASRAPVSHVELDARGLRALAHPVRVRLLGLLRTHGPATATRLAQRMELTSGATSYHLRQLAAAGFVTEDTERGNGRERWWRAMHQSTSFTDRELAFRELDAALGYLRSVVAAHTLLAQRALNELETLPEPWRHAVSLNDAQLCLTPEEAVELRRELSEVVGRYRPHDPTARDAEPEDAERVAVVFHVLPGLDDIDGLDDLDGMGDTGAGRTGATS
ncbi:ArsR/SmtB family transcription factor [Streptomyces triticirhizae]|uniref:ArsR family transcriptional regulator n=1 Tax=Streptomyces triticirhizae TaxID=2483353 RepID=A0A3M2LNV7_9ACTN|nr:helix-turn-helix domain-containing protein [Streptomyces triticirhizae]RMI39151.1 ArsR family transcriptional regulator [Streptomyces triticirhizae]